LDDQTLKCLQQHTSGKSFLKNLGTLRRSGNNLYLLSCSCKTVLLSHLLSCKLWSCPTVPPTVLQTLVMSCYPTYCPANSGHVLMSHLLSCKLWSCPDVPPTVLQTLVMSCYFAASYTARLCNDKSHYTLLKTQCSNDQFFM